MYENWPFNPPSMYYDEEEDEMVMPLDAANIFWFMGTMVMGMIGIAACIIGLVLNAVDAVIAFHKGEKEHKPLHYQYDRYLAARDPELVDYERRWVRYTTARKELPNPARTHIFDVGNGEKGKWWYKI